MHVFFDGNKNFELNFHKKTELEIQLNSHLCVNGMLFHSEPFCMHLFQTFAMTKANFMQYKQLALHRFKHTNFSILNVHDCVHLRWAFTLYIGER